MDMDQYYTMAWYLLWIPHNLNNSLRTVNIDFRKFFDFMEFPNISINNLKLFDVNADDKVFMTSKQYTETI